MKIIISQLDAVTVEALQPNNKHITYIQFPYFLVSQDLTVLNKLRSVKAVLAYAMLRAIDTWGYIPHKNRVSYMYNHLKSYGYIYKNNNWYKPNTYL